MFDLGVLIGLCLLFALGGVERSQYDMICAWEFKWPSKLLDGSVCYLYMACVGLLDSNTYILVQPLCFFVKK